MNKKILFILLGLFVATPVSAQISIEDYFGRVNQTAILNRDDLIKVNSNSVQGSPYYFDEFQSAVIIKGQYKTKPTPINLDLVNQQVLIENNNQIVAVEYGDINEIQIPSQKLVFKNGYPTKGKDDLDTRSIFKVIFEGDNYTILKYSNVSVQRNVTTYNSANNRDIYNLNTDYYILSNGEFDGLSMRKRRFFRVFNDNRKAVEDFVSENNLDRRDDNDLTKIFTFADSL